MVFKQHKQYLLRKWYNKPVKANSWQLKNCICMHVYHHFDILPYLDCLFAYSRTRSNFYANVIFIVCERHALFISSSFIFIFL